MIQVQNDPILTFTDIQDIIIPNVDTYIMSNFEKYFNEYLQIRYGIDSNKLQSIIKNLAPEEFI